jgi:hypothetical protein
MARIRGDTGIIPKIPAASSQDREDAPALINPNGKFLRGLCAV